MKSEFQGEESVKRPLLTVLTKSLSCLVHSMVMLMNLLAGLCFLFGGLDDGTTFGLGTEAAWI